MVENLACRDHDTYSQVILHLEEIFFHHGHKLQRVKDLAQKVKDGIERISPFIEQTTQTVCPDCKDVCCISKHGYYNFEDLVYLYALGLKLPIYEFGRKDTESCQFLSANGCSLKRPFRPSGCNWYFCDSLLNHMEKNPDYQQFDDLLGDIAELWMEMTDEFKKME